MINNLDPDLKFVFENFSKSLNFLGINNQIVENILVFDIYYKPTNSFSYLELKNIKKNLELKNMLSKEKSIVIH